MKQYKKNILLTNLCFITFVLKSWAPFTFNSNIGPDIIRFIGRFLWFIIAGVIFFLTPPNKRIDKGDVCIMATPLIYWLFGTFYVCKGGGRIGSLSDLAICIGFALQDKSIKKDVYNLIKKYFLITSILGIICYIVYILKLPLPYTKLPIYGDTTGAEFEKWGTSIVNYHISYIYDSGVSIVRLCGLYNEPGWFGTFLAFYLCSEKLNLKKWQNKIIFIAGCLTLSLAFFLILIIYWLISSLNNWKRWFLISITFVFILFVVPNFRTGNAAIDFVLDRLTIKNGTWEGDDRGTAEFDKNFELLFDSPRVFIGRGAGARVLAGGSISIKADIMDFGILGTMIIYLPIFYVLFCDGGKNKYVTRFLICIAASLYQRPWLFEPTNFFLTLSAVAYIRDTYPIYQKNRQLSSIYNKEILTI